MYEFYSFALFLGHQKAVGGCTDVRMCPSGSEGYTRHMTSLEEQLLKANPGALLSGLKFDVYGEQAKACKVPYTAEVVRSMAEAGMKCNDYGTLLGEASQVAGELRELAESRLNRGPGGMPEPRTTGPTPEQVISADQLGQRLGGFECGQLLWEAHREFLWSDKQAPAATWESLGPVQKAGFAAMADALRRSMFERYQELDEYVVAAVQAQAERGLALPRTITRETLLAELGPEGGGALMAKVDQAWARYDFFQTVAPTLVRIVYQAVANGELPSGKRLPLKAPKPLGLFKA